MTPYLLAAAVGVIVAVAPNLLILRRCRRERALAAQCHTLTRGDRADSRKFRDEALAAAKAAGEAAEAVRFRGAKPRVLGGWGD